ncbi:MAG: nitroreductase [Porticoccaceae bacterium]|nr:nitroreductase [Pseudomonadales bacterium]MCP5172360.1 nitroreductase [Pseudomonadales bacterium]
MNAEMADVFTGIVNQRRSIRAFRNEPVPADLLERVFESALRSPSNCNTQPWQVHVASGQAVENLRQVLPGCFLRGEHSLDFPYDGKYQGVYQERQYAAANALYEAMGIPRADKQQRQEALLRNFTFFGAPHVAFLFLPEPFGLREACDLGMYAQTVMLSMTAHGLASCPQTALGFLSDPVRETLGVDASQKLVFGISFGFEDIGADINECATDRGNLADFVYFHS